ncbi:MAG: response regulator transcription factor [Chloroflexota bacterium]|nr:MAG: response regulator transcription factor [Chloroflexota bacterium]
MSAPDRFGRPEGGRATRPARILVVEDEPEFAELLVLWLEREGWTTIVAGDGDEALRLAAAEAPDAILLDLSLPGRDGWAVLGALRVQGDLPILLVTARGAEADKLRGLRAGADDYITKPLSFPELIARVAAVLRRARAPEAASRDGASGDGRIERAGLELDPLAHEVRRAGQAVHLTPTEFRLLHHLASRPGQLVGHADLLGAVWGEPYRDDVPVLRATMHDLRRKLGEHGDDGLIRTVHGLGYRFES